MSSEPDYDNVISPKELRSRYADEDERRLLGACLLDADVAAEAVVLVKADDLHRPEHRSLLRLIGTRIAAGQGVSLTDVAGDVAAAGNGKQFGGLGYLAELPEHCPSPRFDLVALARRVRSRAVARELAVVAEALAKVAAGHAATLDGEVLPEDPETAAVEVSQHLAQLGQPGERHDWAIGESLDAAVERRIEARTNERLRPQRTGNRDLDDLLDGGLRRGELIIVAGRPGHGKTAFAMGLASDAAEAGARVGVVSLEMKHDELSDRILSRATGLPLGLIRSGRVDEREDVVEWREVIRGWDLRIADPTGVDVTAIATQARRWSARGLDLLVIDYLQMVRHGRADRHDLAVGRTATACKELARSLQIPVVLLSQLNREVEKRRTGKAKDTDDGQLVDWWETVSLPRASDLRDSGQIEQDADLIVFPVRASEFGHESQQQAGIVVAKNRNGRTGVVPALWDGATASYSSVHNTWGG